MPVSNPRLKLLLQAIDLEEKEQVQRFSLDQQHTLKSLKAEGLALHPVAVTRKTFGYLDYPEISFRINYPAETQQFRDGAAIECFLPGQEPVKGMLLHLEGKTGEFRLFAPDYPDWLEENGVGIKLAPDQRTTALMKSAIESVEKSAALLTLFQEIHGDAQAKKSVPVNTSALTFFNRSLNESQQRAVRAVYDNEGMVILHGPPGTGKTTTVVEAIRQLVGRGDKVLVSAPSNTAVDHLTLRLLSHGLIVLRVGNAGKADEKIFPHTPEGKLGNSQQQKEIRQLKKRAEEFRRMALKYKKSFGKAEREQRNLLFKEVKNIRTEIKKIQAYNEEKLFAGAQVISGTPVGLSDARLHRFAFASLVIDEAGQCIEPLAWCIFPLAMRYVLAGDHLQLPPTIISPEAARLGLNRSVLEAAADHLPDQYLLDTQYRMREAIAGFSGQYFYRGLLRTPAVLLNNGQHLFFIDTAGSGYQETRGNDRVSLQNRGELDIVRQLLTVDRIIPADAAFISPYSGQVAAARELLPAGMRISTIDSFQGQEKEVIILSLVRSNDDGDIGFLKDYRRMNVAITRAKERLYVIGDSATIGSDPFFLAFLAYAETRGTYRTAWEFDPYS
jgi:ATP-dependent RNA/DNA helicase IGHMBP2